MDFYTKCEHLFIRMRLKWHLFILLLIIAEISCNIGKIYPKGPIIRQVHSDINVTCMLTDTDASKSDLLSFFIGRTEFPSEIINDTTIQLSLRNVEAMDEIITCKKNRTVGVDMRKVMVGTPPTEIKDFGCLSYDFNYFVCKFRKPNNPVRTTYNLTYLVQTSLYTCPTLDKDSPIYVCNITMESARYRHVHDIYNFTLQSINDLGSRIDNYTISHFSSVIPGKPSVNITNIEPDSAVLEWDVKKPLYSEIGLVYDINIVSVHSKGIWKQLDTSNINSTLIPNYYKLSNLYPHTWYEVQLRLKVANAVDIPEMWTETNTTFQTKSREPDEPPHVDIGSFQPQSNYITNITSFVIYWRGVPKYKENGGDIHYVIKEVKMNGKEVNIKPNEISQYSAKFVLQKADYEFTIYTANEKGISNVGTVLRVPKKEYPLPQQIKKIYKENTYILMWSEPDGDIPVKDYTIFSCISKSETFDQCESGFNFTHENRDSRNITYKTKEKMNFAISANYFNASSGMVWALCTALESSDFGIITPKGIPKNGTTIKLDWSLECVYSTIVEGFRLSYCPITINASCITPMKTLNISGEKREYYLHNLKPYTTYRIWMSMYSVTKQGPESNYPLEITTLESSPTPPRRLSVLNVTDHSIGLQWQPPASFNGPLRYYKIIYNNENVRMEVEQLRNQTLIVANLNKLSSYKNYKIYVIASTGSFDSLPSNDCSVRTAIGTPGSLEQPKVSTEDQSSSMTVSWSPPAVPSGPIHYYELKTSIFKENNFILDRILRINGTQCTMRLLRDNICQNHSHKFEFYVRAVNAIPKEVDRENMKHKKVQTSMNDPFAVQCEEENHELLSWFEENEDNMVFLKGEWSTALMHFCHYAAETSDSITIIASLFSFGGLSICFYFLWKKYIKMKNIGIAFPPGLADLDQVSRPKGCDNIITRDIAHSDESLYKNENHHLLASNRIDSGYLNGLDCTDKSETVDFDDSSEIVAVRHNDEDNSSGHAESVEMSDMSESSPTESPNINLREKSMQHPPPTSIPYMNPIIINGYVQHQSFQKPPEPPIFNYTQMSTLDNSKIPTNLTTTENDSLKHKEPSSINSGVQENICGYVTHKQLSEFGHRQQ